MINTVTIDGCLQYATQALEDVSHCPALEAEILLSHALKKSRSHLYAYPKEWVSLPQFDHFVGFLNRRSQKEPIAYITGSRAFWSFELMVNQDTLIPRPETECVVEAVLKLFPSQQGSIKVADLGTGCGAIALALQHEHPSWEIVATDSSASALNVAEQNAKRLGLDQIIFRQGHWCTALDVDRDKGLFDVIVSNPPYISDAEWETYQAELVFEPRGALLGGVEGLDAIRHLSLEAGEYLKPGGYLVIEHGFAQGEPVRALLQAQGYRETISLKDLLGYDRVSIALGR